MQRDGIFYPLFLISFNDKWNEAVSKMDDRQKKILQIVMAAILLISMYFVAGEGAAYVHSDSVYGRNTNKNSVDKEDDRQQREQKYCVVIDAGHGGADPGKVGINGVLEKDVNLKIARKLKRILEAQDVRVVMTREDENGLYDEGASNRKVQDMKRRIALIEEAQPHVVISIHQNSYHEESVHGAQVFYYNASAAGKTLAGLIQKRFLVNVDSENKREAKGNDSYYLLKKTSCPIAIVECGFLSNREEAEKLNSEIYQERAAWAIHMGVMQYLNHSR